MAAVREFCTAWISAGDGTRASVARVNLGMGLWDVGGTELAVGHGQSGVGKMGFSVAGALFPVAGASKLPAGARKLGAGKPPFHPVTPLFTQ